MIKNCWLFWYNEDEELRKKEIKKFLENESYFDNLGNSILNYVIVDTEFNVLESKNGPVFDEATNKEKNSFPSSYSVRKIGNKIISLRK